MSSFEPLYREYRCTRNAPLSCDQIQATLQEMPGSKFCIECGFPTTLLEKTELKGTRGTYRVVRFLGARGMGRLYAGVQASDNQPVVIKEYLLPSKHFNKEETRQRKDAFVRVAGLTPADGKSQDFRLVNPWEAIADQQSERCYLITRGNLEVSQNLLTYLAERGPMTSPQVRAVLDQVLQSLLFLHNQKFRLPSGQIQPGIAHGNLNLESLLILEGGDQFYIYVCDLALWDRLFDPPPAQSAQPMPPQDLPALAMVAYYLLTGTFDATGTPLDPRNPQHWPPTVEPRLRELLLRMMGYDVLPAFDTAEAARRAVLALPREDQEVNDAGVAEEEAEEKSKISPKAWILIAILLALLIGLIVYFVILPAQHKVPTDIGPDPRRPDFVSVPSFPQGTFKYGAENAATWTYVLGSKPSSTKTMSELLTAPITKVKMNFQKQISDDILAAESPDQWISKPVESVRSKTIDFAVTSMIDNLPDELDKKIFAYDAILFYVADNKRPGNLPRALKGQISLDHIRGLYTGKIDNWKTLGGPDLRVKLYIPPEPETLRMFEKLVFNDDPNQLELFYKMIRSKQIQLSPTKDTLNQLSRDKEQGIEGGGVSFGVLTKLYGQCSGYYLAISDQDKSSVQAFVRQDLGNEGQPINPEVDLCNKSGYRVDKFGLYGKQYPLGFPMAVVYPKDDSVPPAGPKFADLLLTREGQEYLSKLGIAPLPWEAFSNK